MKKNIKTYDYKVSCYDRRILKKHNSFLIFFTGLSGAGKSTIANKLEQRLFEENVHTYVLDGDNIRKGINKQLGFSPEDRSENNRRIGEISKLFIDAGIVVLAAFISPYRKDRLQIKQTVSPNNYVEVFVNTSLEVCESRDAKGLYKRARAGEISNMTGVSDPYEPPLNPDIEITDKNSLDESVEMVYDKIKNKLKL